ncbi:virulence RhuM family protein [Sulfurivirga caldicuralii]|uniref:virulence RhuM family protein n=1 Tax=Sulfurivirga caldicuralii TaxID=364032 RepID=UPI000A87FDB2|nr:RhuM family protein [Sulfurivirga caldicuralii]
MRDILIYENDQQQIEVLLEGETVWLNRQQMAMLFGRDVKTIGKHIANVFREGELDRAATVAKFATVQKEGGREVIRQVEYYNLDVIISVGYRVKSLQGTRFRIWATQRLKDYLLKGYAINQRRLAQNTCELEYTLELVRKAAASSALGLDSGRGQRRGLSVCGFPASQ